MAWSGGQMVRCLATLNLWSLASTIYDFVVNQRRTRLLKGIMISIIDLVGKDALYLKTVSWVSSIILHTDTDTDTDTDTGVSTHESEHFEKLSE